MRVKKESKKIQKNFYPKSPQVTLTTVCPRLLIISISHQLQRSAGGGNDDAGTRERPHLMGW